MIEAQKIKVGHARWHG